MMEPSEGPSPSLVEDALRDLRNRTLAKLDGDLARLVYLASMDCRSGSPNPWQKRFWPRRTERRF
jgi:hypothetical protein